MSSAVESSGEWEISGRQRGASSIVQSGERRGLEEKAIAAALREQVEKWLEKGERVKLQCAELLFVRGWPNKEVAVALGITEQHVANYKFDFLARMRAIVKKQGLPEEVFPELYQTE